MVERWSVAPDVGGSNPLTHPKYHLECLGYG